MKLIGTSGLLRGTVCKDEDSDKEVIELGVCLNGVCNIVFKLVSHLLMAAAVLARVLVLTAVAQHFTTFLTSNCQLEIP